MMLIIVEINIKKILPSIIKGPIKILPKIVRFDIDIDIDIASSKQLSINDLVFIFLTFTFVD